MFKFKIEALREYFTLKSAKLAANISLSDIVKNLNDLIKNLDCLYVSDIQDSGKFNFYSLGWSRIFQKLFKIKLKRFRNGAKLNPESDNHITK